jgi:hypothetical protein
MKTLHTQSHPVRTKTHTHTHTHTYESSSSSGLLAIAVTTVALELLNAQNGEEENNDRYILNVLKADQKKTSIETRRPKEKDIHGYRN